MLSLSKYEGGGAYTTFFPKTRDFGQALPVLPSSSYDRLRMRVP